MKTLIRTAALALTLAAAPLATAIAQPAGGPEGGFNPMTHMCQDMDAHHAAMLAYGEAKLKLTDAQKPAYKKLSDSLAAAHEPMRKLCADPAGATMPTQLPARLERMQKVTEARTDAMRRAIPAIKEFYGQLSADQQKIADAMMTGRHGGGMGMGMMRHH
jgi:protein CpxP